MKSSTKRAVKKLGPETARIIRKMSGAAATIARVGKMSRSYVCRVLSGEKPPSKRFLLAMGCVLDHLKGQADLAIVRHEHPEVENQ